MTASLPAFNAAALALRAERAPRIAQAIAQGDAAAMVELILDGPDQLALRALQEEAWAQIMAAGHDDLAERWWAACPPFFVTQPFLHGADARAALYDRALDLAAHHGRMIWTDRLVAVLAERYRFSADDPFDPEEAVPLAYETALMAALNANQPLLVRHLVQSMPVAAHARLVYLTWINQEGQRFEPLVRHASEPPSTAQWQAWGDALPVRVCDPTHPDEAQAIGDLLALARPCLPHLRADQLVRQLYHVHTGTSEVQGLPELLYAEALRPERRMDIREALGWISVPPLEERLRATERAEHLANQPARSRSLHRPRA